MTTLEVGLFSYLSTYGGLVALIGDRVYPMHIPQEATLPCLTYQRISTPRHLTHQSSGATGDLASPRFQFDAWATTDDSAKAIVDQVRAALNGKTGEIGTAPSNITVRAVLVENEVPEYFPEVRLYRCRSDYFIWHEEE
jgi:hypothetical protein